MPKLMGWQWVGLGEFFLKKIVDSTLSYWPLLLCFQVYRRIATWDSSHLKHVFSFIFFFTKSTSNNHKDLKRSFYYRRSGNNLHNNTLNCNWFFFVMLPRHNFFKQISSLTQFHHKVQNKIILIIGFQYP